MKIKGKILTIMISLLFSVVSVSIIAVYFNFNNYITENTLETQYNMSMNLINAKYDGDWNVKDNKLYKGDFLINDNFEIVDLIKGSCQSEVTIFLKDTRVTTTIIEDDKRVIGTKADAEIVSKVLSNDEKVKAGITLFNEKYKTLYSPIKDKEGKVLGMFFIGIKESTIWQEVKTMLQQIIIYSLVIFIISLLMVNIFTAKVIIHPILKTSKYLDALSNGDLTFRISDYTLNRKDEFGIMANSLLKTKLSLKDILKKIKENSNNALIQSDNLASVSEEISESSSNVTCSIQEVTIGINNQAEGLMYVSNFTNDFGEALENIISSIDDVNNKINEI
ncbi:methyl-accepting chemotaxis protein [Clostridium isatidis]